MERCSFRKCSPGYDHDNDEWSKQYAPKLTNAFAPCIVPGASNFGGNIDLSGYLGADEKAARKALLHCLWTYECAAAYCAPAMDTNFHPSGCDMAMVEPVSATDHHQTLFFAHG